MGAFFLRACLKIPKGPVFAERTGWQGATREDTRQGSPTEKQRSQPVLSAKTLRAAGLLPVAFVGSVLTARCGDARTSPPRPPPKSLAAGPFAIFRQALRGSPQSCFSACLRMRSEEHTSELQSRSDLVCRLLLEKKKEESTKNHAYEDEPSPAKLAVS